MGREKKMKKELKEIITIGLLGSLWLKSIEWYSIGTLVLNQLVAIIVLVPLLVWFVYKFKKSFLAAFIPSAYYFLKEIYNSLVTGNPSFILFGLFEAILFGVPIGLAFYYLVHVKKWVRIWPR